MAIIQDKNLCKVYSRARRSRDARFDGLFFTAVKTTRIYCRSICPATTPKEVNVEYHATAVSAALAGFRPCLRCRPDSAPQSNAWQGTDTTLQRAVKLIQEGALQEASLEELSDRLGVSSRYLRSLFQEKLGTSPKKFALYQQCLFAKQLLHDSNLPIADIAFTAGFNSVRRFNEAMQERLHLSPSQIRKQNSAVVDAPHSAITLKLHYREPFAVHELLAFLQRRLIEGLEWVGDDHYGRTICFGEVYGWFEIRAVPAKAYLELVVQLSDLSLLYPVVQRIRILFDLDAPVHEIDRQLQSVLNGALDYLPGLRIPGIWGGFEAGVRAILGQQVSVQQAHSLVTRFVHELGERVDGHLPSSNSDQAHYYFPNPEAVVEHELGFFRMPQTRKDTLRRLAHHMITAEEANDYDAWLTLKGIGPWTVNYVKLRAAKDPDVWLAGDAGVKNALKLVDASKGVQIDVEAAQPWRSYLVFQLWNQL